MMRSPLLHPSSLRLSPPALRQRSDSAPQVTRTRSSRDTRYPICDLQDLRRSEARLALGVLFQIDIANWQLVSADLEVQGQARLTAHATISGSRSWALDHHLPLLRDVGIGSVTFMVGPVRPSRDVAIMLPMLRH